MTKTLAFLVGIGAMTSASLGRPVYNYVFGLDGLQEVPPVITPGFGNAEVTLDTDALTLSWVVTYQDLLAATTAAHFHGEALPGQTAGVKIDIGAISGLDSPMIGSAPITIENANNIIAGLWYINVHSTMHRTGEIHGQVVPAPAGLGLLALGGLAASRRRR